MVFLPSSRLRTFARCGPLPFADTYLNAIEEEMPNGAFFPCRPEHPQTGTIIGLWFAIWRPRSPAVPVTSTRELPVPGAMCLAGQLPFRDDIMQLPRQII